MQNLLAQPALQQQTLRFYGELIALAPNWAGKLLLGVGEGCSSGGFPAASSLCGGASLSLEPSRAHAKAALRDGGLDFLVSTVDEALRTLKNEVRKGRPLAVALSCDENAARDELYDRGVLPDLVFSTGEQAPSQPVVGRWAGVRTLFDPAQSGSLESERLRLYLREQKFETYTWALLGRPAFQALDAALLAMLDEADVVRRRWLNGITRYQQSSDRDSRTFWLTREEHENFAATPGVTAS